MGKFDEAWKRFFSDPARFADVVNVYCHAGRQVVKAEDIREADSAQGIRMRDTVRKIVSGQEIMICGIESQEDMDPSLAWRVMGYDYREYEKQIRLIRKKNAQLFANSGDNCRLPHTQGTARHGDKHQVSHSQSAAKLSGNLTEPHIQGSTDKTISQYRDSEASDMKVNGKMIITSGEYMYKYLKTDKLRPVGTIVIYSGGKWDGPRSMWELCGLPGDKAERLKIVNDYPLHIIELRELKEEYIDLFVTDIKQVFKVLKNMGDRDKIKQEIASDERYDHLDKDAGRLIGAYCGREAERLLEKKEEEPMSSIREDFEKMMAEERDEGKREGERRARRQEREKSISVLVKSLSEAGIKEDAIAEKISENYDLTVEQATRKVEKYRPIPA